MIQHPSIRTGLFPTPRHYNEWVFKVGLWPDSSTRKILASIKMSYTVLKTRRLVVLVIPNTGHEQAVWNICLRMFIHVDKAVADKLLK